MALRMFLPIDNAPRDYAWGSRTAIAEALGRAASGRPEAELWLGTHPGSPSFVIEPGVAPSERMTLDTYLSEHGQPPLGFLLKVLAAERPLSLQVHPTTEQAREGFARENSAGIPIDARHRNYRDASAKPELIMALADGFEALSGFREISESLKVVRGFARAASAAGDVDGASALTDFALLIAQRGLADAVTFALTDSGATDIARAVRDAAAMGASDISPRDRETVLWLADEYGADPGILIALLLHRVTLQTGQALYLGAGNLHAYLRGLGIEVMAASDNVLRGGLTSKHVDVPELLRVASWEPVAAPVWPASPEGPGVVAFRPPVDDFVLYSVRDPQPSAVVTSHDPSIVLVLDGELSVSGASSSTALTRGQALFVSADEFPLSFAGRGHAVLATGQNAEN